ncbi:uncharacterized protein LOC102611090 isoform X2 [Citrus sinensis]|uniref:uncharacterized protein LOC102611090 isoform X2 n=1 Tax=Citrus sinensis TaxID=2711 RepID=UPI0022791BA7|nr:uncharacterized protein LOC102611090 isoform X2 [Citrus sinensis]
MSNPRTIKLFCPSVSNLIQFVAWDEQRLDLGSIARAFGLDPSTVKLNGHFISRGFDFVSSSVTWRPLIKFFSAKGLSTGKDDKDALIVDGKLSKVGSKPPVCSICRRPLAEDINLFKNKKLKDSSSGYEEGDHHAAMSNGLGLKRKHSLEDLCLLKKLKIKESNSDCQGSANKHCSTFSRTQFTCSHMSDSVKGPRENEVITATPCKRIR